MVILLRDDHPLIRVLRIDCVFDNDYYVPGWLGTAIRGVFGYSLRKEVCITRKKSCRGCPYTARCPYKIIFETSSRSFFGAMSKVGYKLVGITKPYTLTNIIVREGLSFNFELNLFGGYTFSQEAMIVNVIRRMGELGLGRCPRTKERRKFSVLRILSVNPFTKETDIVFGEGIYKSPIDGRPTDITRGLISDVAEDIVSTEPRLLKMEFLTPTMVIAGGAPEIPPSLSSILKNITRKILFLSEYFWNSSFFDVNIVNVIKRVEENTRIEISNIKRMTISRFSMKKAKFVKIHDFIRGTVFYKIGRDIYRDLTGKTLFESLLMGKFLHIGKLATMGAGMYYFEVYS